MSAMLNIIDIDNIVHKHFQKLGVVVRDIVVYPNGQRVYIIDVPADRPKGWAQTELDKLFSEYGYGKPS